MIRALEALEDGDPAFAAEILRSALKDRPAGPRQHRCECGNTFRWPGELDRHRIISGHQPRQESRGGSVRVFPPQRTTQPRQR